MSRVGTVALCAVVTVFQCSAAAPGQRPRVDDQAMQEAMNAAREQSLADHVSSAAYSHYLRSRMHHNAGQHKQAARELELALTSDDGSAMLLTALAEEYARLAELGRSEKILRKALDLAPKYAPAQALAGRLLLEQGQYARAKLHLRRAIELAPKEVDNYLAAAQLELEQNNPDGAIKLADELSKLVPAEPLAYKRLGLAFADRGDVPRALKTLEAAAKRDVGDFDVQMTLAGLYETAGKFPAAEGAYEKALMRDPENLTALLAAGRLALRQESTQRATAYFRQLRSLTDEAEWAVKVAFAYLTANEPALAAETLDAARKVTKEPRVSFYAGLVHEKTRSMLAAAKAYAEVPEDSELYGEALLRRATCLSVAGRHTQALEVVRKALKASPDQVALYPTYARTLERSGAVAQSERVLLDAIERFGEPELIDALSDSYERQGRRKDAVGLLERELAKRPDDEGLLFALGTIYERLGDHASSLAHMRQILTLNPENAAAHNFIGYTLADRGISLDDAETSILKALELRPESGAFLDSLGWLYFRRGEYSQAVSTLEKATSLAPSEPVIREHLGDAYRGARRLQDAADAYRHALRALHEIDEPADQQHMRTGLEKKLRAISTETTSR